MRRWRLSNLSRGDPRWILFPNSYRFSRHFRYFREPANRSLSQAAWDSGVRRKREELNILPEHYRDDELLGELMVNGIPVQSVHIRCASDSSDVFQVLIDDPQIGSICLHDGFELKIRERDAWRPLTLEQLKKTLSGRCEFLRLGDMPNSSEIVERRLFDRLDDVDMPHRSSPRLGELTDHAECVRQVRNVLRGARIPHRVAGTVFIVPSVRRTRGSCSFEPAFAEARLHRPRWSSP